MYKRWLRVIVNRKAAAAPKLWPAIAEIRDQGHQVEVQVVREDVGLLLEGKEEV